MVWHLTDGGVNLLTPSELKARILAIKPFDPKNELLKGVALKRVTLQNHTYDGYRLLAKPFYDEFCVKEKRELYAYEIPDYLSALRLNILSSFLMMKCDRFLS